MLDTFGTKAVLALSLMLSMAGTALAFEVTPMRAEMRSSGTRTTVTLRVQNPDRQPLPVEIYMERREVTPEGEQRFVRADGDFTVFPPQALVPPGQTQAVRVQYVGPRDLDTSRAYVANVSQVPVRPESGESGVVLVYRFGAALYVVPESAVADPVLADSRVENGELVVEIANEGRAHAFLSNDRFDISTGSGTVTLEGEALGDLIRNPIMPPGMVRVFRLRVPGLGAGPVDVSYRHQPD